MKCYSLLIGANNARGYFLRRDERSLREITARYFPAGFTILHASGSWYDPEARTFRKEEARQLVICTSQPTKLGKWCGELGRALRQKELILIEVGPARRYQLSAEKLSYQTAGRPPTAGRRARAGRVQRRNGGSPGGLNR